MVAGRSRRRGAAGLPTCTLTCLVMAWYLGSVGDTVTRVCPMALPVAVVLGIHADDALPLRHRDLVFHREGRVAVGRIDPHTAEAGLLPSKWAARVGRNVQAGDQRDLAHVDWPTANDGGDAEHGAEAALSRMDGTERGPPVALFELDAVARLARPRGFRRRHSHRFGDCIGLCLDDTRVRARWPALRQMRRSRRRA